MKEDRARGDSAGMNDYLAKPITLKSLQACIVKYLKS